MRMLELPPQKLLREMLDYDHETGIFVWRKSPSANTPAGTVAGADKGNGYRMIGIKGVRYLAHRLAWMHFHGGDPLIEVDHENRIRNDNRIDNLRPAGMKGNSGNIALPSHNTSGRKGVCWDKSRNRWIVHIKINGRQKFLGRYTSIENATAAYDAAAEDHFGEFALTNRKMAA